MKAKLLLILVTLMPLLASGQEDNLFTRDYNEFYVGITAGWVAKDWTTTLNGRTVHEDMWGNPDKMLHGMQFGLKLEHCLYQGLGYRTALYYEWYISKDKCLKDMGWDRFSEHCLYLPLHAMIRMTPIKNVSIVPFGGIGFNWAITGKLKSGPLSDGKGWNQLTRNQYPLEYFDYNNHTPHHWNVQAEAGVALRVFRVELSFTYSWGLNKHQLYDIEPSRQNKMAVNLSYVLPTE